MKNKVLNIMAAASAVALAMAPITVHAAGTECSTGQGKMGANDCVVSIADYDGARANVMIPKTITMTGVKKCDYPVTAFCLADKIEDIDSDLTVTPAASFTLTKNGGSETATATVTQDKTTFTKADLAGGVDGTMNFQDSAGATTAKAVKKVETKGHIEANVTSGSWTGTLVFTIS